MFERVVICTDLKQGSAHAIARAALLPVASDAILTLIHVVQDGDARDARAALEGVARDLELRLRARGSKALVDAVVAQGRAHQEILALADTAHAEIIILGRHRSRPLADWIGVGTTADRVVRGARVPVLVVGRRPRQSYRVLLAGVDHPPSQATRQAIDAALRLVVGPVSVLAVHAAEDLLLERALRRGGVAPGEISRQRRAGLRRRRQEVRKTLDELQGGASFALKVRSGDPRRVLLDEIERGGIDLVALGVRTTPLIERWLMGSVAEAVLRAASCDVLLARGADGDVRQPL